MVTKQQLRDWDKSGRIDDLMYSPMTTAERDQPVRQAFTIGTTILALLIMLGAIWLSASGQLDCALNQCM